MPDIKGMLPVGVIVITAIVALFVLAVVLLLYLSARYKFLSAAVAGSGDKSGGFLRYVKEDFSQAYKKYGQEVNTPALVANAVSVKLPGLLLIERFINNAVSLFVTLGLFGTFLGLSLSVSSLTELIGYSNTDQWLSVLDSVGTGLMSALSGMGVAFYTSLAGVACSIILTLLRSVFSPQAQREKLETQVELWLDHELAPTLPTERAKDDVQLVHQMIRSLDSGRSSSSRKSSICSLLGSGAGFGAASGTACGIVSEAICGICSGFSGDFTGLSYGMFPSSVSLLCTGKCCDVADCSC